MDETLMKKVKDLTISKYLIYEPDSVKVAQEIKTNLDETFGKVWHAIIGKAYGFEVTCEKDKLLYSRIDEDFAILIWKSK